VAVRTQPLSQLLLALLLTASAVTAACAESDWVESVFPVKGPVAEAARKPPAKPERLVKTADRKKTESETAKNQQKQQERQAEKRKVEVRKADAKVKQSEMPIKAMPSNAIEMVPPVSAAPAMASIPPPPVTNDDRSTRMRLGGIQPLEAPPTTPQALTPIAPPSWMPAPTFANPAAGPSLGKQETVKATSAMDAAHAAMPEANTASGVLRSPSKQRDGESAQATRHATSPASAGATVSGAAVSVAAVTQAAKAVLSPPPAPTDSLELEVRAAAIARGQRLWMQRRGPRNASLEECNLGLGAGRVVGTFAHLPRYFADANRVMDLQSRIAWCAKVAQDVGLDALMAARTIDGVTATEMEDLAVYVASLSASWRLSPPSAHAKESVTYEVGQALYVRRQGPLDFSCATCHGAAVPGGGDPQSQAPSQPIRFWKSRPVPQLGSPAESQASIGNWPAWRAAHGRIQTLQGRIAACFGHMGVEPPAAASDAAIALATYLTRQAERGEVLAPGRKR
jgi:L-cysteine S-thiosulfotransferase